MDDGLAMILSVITVIVFVGMVVLAVPPLFYYLGEWYNYWWVVVK